MKPLLFFTTLTLIATSMTSRADARESFSTDYCREFNKTIIVGGRPQAGYGTACQQQDGSWRVVSDDEDRQESSVKYISSPQPTVYYQETVRPVYIRDYDDRRPYYGRYPSSSVSISFGGGHDRRYRKYDRWDRFDRFDDRHDWRRHHGYYR